jgi:pre-rRNA-processing protein TSR3
MERRYADVEPRSLPSAVTVYRRVSRVFPDPTEGLASIEALIVAFSVLDADPAPLIARYVWGTDFVHRNRDIFAP